MKIITYTDAIVKFAFAEMEVYYSTGYDDDGVAMWKTVTDKDVFANGGEGYIFGTDTDE